MKPTMLVWLTVCVSLVVALSVTAISGWVLGVVVALALVLEVLAIPLSVNALTTR
jgi:hypothetical protein